MALLRHSFLKIVLAMMALTVFAGDLVGDALHDIAGDCTGEVAPHSNDGGKCAVCTCAVHTAAAIPFKTECRIAPLVSSPVSFSAWTEHVPNGVPAPIDHPPQLG